jgi:hypothetical protein
LVPHTDRQEHRNISFGLLGIGVTTALYIMDKMGQGRMGMEMGVFCFLFPLYVYLSIYLYLVGGEVGWMGGCLEWERIGMGG